MANKRAAILTNQFFSWEDPGKLACGGGERITGQLADLLVDLGYETHIYQFSPLRFDRSFKDLHIHGISNLRTTHGCFLTGLGDYFYNATRDFDKIIIALPDVAGNKIREDAILLTQGISWAMKPIDELLDVEKEHLGEVWGSVGTNVVVHQYTTDAIRDLGVGGIADKIICIENSVDADVFKPTSKEKIVLFPARAEVAKGTDFVPEILDRLDIPDWKIEWWGDGSQFDKLKELERKHENFSVASSLMSGMRNVYSPASISVCFNLESKGNSLTMMESMASECAVIGIKGGTTLIDDGINGLLCPADAGRIAHNINILAKNPRMRSNLGARARKDMICGHSVDAWERRWTEILKWT